MNRCSLLFLVLVALALRAVAAPQAEARVPVARAENPSEHALDGLAERVETELRGNILPFWMRHARDHARGGFFGEISNDLVVKQNATRGALLTSRILWTYSAAYRRYRDPAYLEMARWAHEDLVTRFWDEKHGGLFWTISADGKPLVTQKQVYGQVFGLYALSEYHRATGDAGALDRAVRLFRLLEEHARDPEHGGYFEVCSRDWKREKNARRSALEPHGAKSQNTHLHVMEAYTNLLRVWPDDTLRRAQRDLLELMLTRILDAKSKHLVLFLAADWRPVSDEISFGHDIEASWLLTEAADVLGDPVLVERTRRVAVEIARVTGEQGLAADGSLLYEADPRGVTNDLREWWPQAEAAVGFLNAYQLSGDARFATHAVGVWSFIEARLVDRKHGEWFRAVDGQGVVSKAPKVSLWKCPYHNGRACLELLERLEKLGKK